MKPNESILLAIGTSTQNSPPSRGLATQLRPEFVLPLADPHAILELVGGKGAALARLAAAGLPVPGGFHVTTTAYQHFVAVNHLQPDILAALATVDSTRAASLESAAQSIYARFDQATMPVEIADAITEAYMQLPGELPVVAVRSSATAEDLPELSFAGQQETFLNVQGVAALHETVKRCWASLWTARAIAYRRQHGVDQEAIRLAVVVQLLVPADAAGILFTANPITGRRDQAMISAAWGLGEAIVAGTVTPDLLTLNTTTGQLLERTTADKQVMTVRIEGATQEQATPPDLRHAPVLNDQQAQELVRMGLEIEKLYSMPMDIEWAMCEGKLAILQARPITALPPEVPASIEWTLPDPNGQYGRSSIVEQMPDPLTPLFATLGLEVIDAATKRMYDELFGIGVISEAAVVTINDYAYLSMGTFMRKLVWRMIVISVRDLPRLMRTGELRWREEAHAPYVAVINTWRDKPLVDLPTKELLNGVRQLLDRAATTYTILQSGLIPMSTISEGIFTVFYDRLIKRKDDPPAMTYLIGFDSAPILAEKALYDLAVWCRDVPDLAPYMAQTPASELAAQLFHGDVPEGVDATHWYAWQLRAKAYLQQYGHTIYNLDFARPVPADEPTPLLETCKLFLTGQIGSPHVRQQQLAERREAAFQQIIDRLDWLRRLLFRKLVRWAQKHVSLREDGLADLGLGYPLLREMLREVGRRFVQAGVVEQVDDLFWLVDTEVNETEMAIERGEPVDSLDEHVRSRKAIWQVKKNVTPPPILPQKKTRFLGIDMQKFMPTRTEEEQVGATIRGVAASPGCVTATACVLHGPADFGQMEPGLVLVAPTTTPAWTPLFAMAAAVVTDVGGPLSHSSIVAREYGIPAVLGTGVATKRIQNGEVITVDGNAGTVLLAQRPVEETEQIAQP